MRVPRWLALVVLASTLVLAAPASAAAPPNDTVAGATIVGGVPFTATQSTVGATDDPGYDDSYCGMGSGVWFKFVPSQSGRVVVHTRGSTFDTTLSYFDFSSTWFPNSSQACSDDTARQRSSFGFDAVAGHNYYIHAGGFLGATGTLKLSVGRGGTLAGVVRDAASGQPVYGACVSLFGGGYYNEAYSSTTGFYAFAGLPSGQYRPEFQRFCGSVAAGAEPPAPTSVAEGRISRSPDILLPRVHRRHRHR